MGSRAAWDLEACQRPVSALLNGTCFQPALPWHAEVAGFSAESFGRLLEEVSSKQCSEKAGETQRVLIETGSTEYYAACEVLAKLRAHLEKLQITRTSPDRTTHPL